MKSLRRSGRFWLSCFLVWFVALNFLSHGDRFHPSGVSFFFDFPHIDKVLHFGYFFGGAGILAAGLFLTKSKRLLPLALQVTLALAVIGAWDEYHQSFFHNRTGNDFGDWLADVTGAFCGCLVFWKLRGRVQEVPSSH